MAKIFNGMIPFASAIQPTGAQPLDDRVVVATMADLTDASTFGDAKYNGMLVAVIETQQVYMLVDDVNSTNSDSWVQIGTDFSLDISDIESRIDVLEYVNDNVVSKRLSITNNSGLTTNSDGGLTVKIAPNTENFTNGVVVDETGLKVSTYDLQQVEGNALQYNFIVDGQTKTTINIPKDQFLKDASFHATAEDGVAVEAPYLKFVWDLDINEDLEGIQNVTYVPVKDLVDTYTAGNYITITDNVIDVNYNKVALNLTETLELPEKWAAINANTTAIGDARSGLVADVAKNASDIETLNTNYKNLRSSVTALENLDVVNGIDDTATHGIGLTSTTDTDGKVTAKVSVDINKLAAAVIAKHEIPTPVASEINVTDFGTYKDSNVQAVLENLDTRITAAAGGGVQSIVTNPGSGIAVDSSDVNNPAISINIEEDSALTINENNKIDLVWSEL